MDKKLILELNHHNVYLVKSDIINYYIGIPKEHKDTNITIEIKNKMDNYNMESNDEIWVIENIKSVYSYIDDYNITLVLPILTNEDVNVLEKMHTNKFEFIDKIIANIINSAYLTLKENEINVAKQIILINNDRYKTFINWFIAKYRDRIVVKNLLEIIQFYNVNATSYKKLETPVMNFVVGLYNTEIDAPKAINIEENKEQDVQLNQKLVPQPAASGGFISYWVLIVIILAIAAIIALIGYIY